MADFDICYPFLLANEDYTPPRYESVPDPTKSDPGARAISGINSAAWPVQFAAIEALSQQDRPQAVKDFYRQNFWTACMESLTSNKIAAMVLDASVNQGSRWGVRFLQTACGADVDGICGPNTLAAANGTSLEVLIPAFIEARQARYRAVGGPSLNAWLARAQKVPAFD